MTDPQIEYLGESTAEFAKSLTKHQLDGLYWLLDNLIQYGPAAKYIIYNTVTKIRALEE